MSNRRSVRRFSGVLAVVTVSYTCSHDTSGPDGEGNNSAIAPNAVILDSTQVTLQPDSAAEANGVFTFVVTGPPPNLTAGSVIVGAQGGGFLRRVSAVHQDRSSLVLTTTQASLTDVVVRGSLHDSSQTGPPTAPQRGYGPTLVPLASGAYVQNGDVILDNVELIKTSNASLTASGRVHYDPEIIQHLEIASGRVQSLQIGAKGDLTFDTDIAVSGIAAQEVVSVETPLYAYTTPFFKCIRVAPAVCLPVVGSNVLTIYAVAGLGLDKAATVGSGFQSTIPVAVGAQYLKNSNPQWSSLILTGDGSFSPKPVAFSASTTVHAWIGAKVEVRMTFFHVAGPLMSVKLVANYARTVDLVTPSAQDKCEALLTGALGFDVTILETHIPLYSASKDLWHRTFCQSAVVAGTADIYLSGQASGTCVASPYFGPDAKDCIPAEGAVFAFGGLVPGSSLEFVVGGATNNSPTDSTQSLTPDGGNYQGPEIFGDPNPFGLSPIGAVFNCLVGVFLSEGGPNPAQQPSALDFVNGGNPGTTGFQILEPALQQVFFIGDGLTGTGTGQRQQFVVPPGATRLFLGSLDGLGTNANNGGAFTVAVALESVPARLQRAPFESKRLTPLQRTRHPRVTDRR